MADMPAILRQAAQMGLFSSAALVRFLAMDVRPNVTRLVTRSLPPSVSGAAGRAAEHGGANRRAAGCWLTRRLPRHTACCAGLCPSWPQLPQPTT